jgi:hypothetical protein
MPNIDNSALERLSITASNDSMQVGIICSWLELANDGSVVGLRGNSGAVEGTEDCGGRGLFTRFGEAGVLEPVLNCGRLMGGGE